MKKKILHIEDSKEYSIFFNALLGKDFLIVTKTNGLDGLEEFLKNPNVWDLIVCDFHMPSMTGDKVVQRIREVNEGVTIIANSSSENCRLIKAGADLEFSKSELIEVGVGLIKEALNKDA